jgi:hypothetical protein
MAVRIYLSSCCTLIAGLTFLRGLMLDNLSLRTNFLCRNDMSRGLYSGPLYSVKEGLRLKATECCSHSTGNRHPM